MIKLENEKTIDIICDGCGGSCKVHENIVDNDLREDNGKPFYVFEFMNLKTHWGYWSDKDTEKWESQICEKCVDEKMSFIKFQKSTYI